MSLIASVILNTRSVNLMENAAALPREIGSIDHRYQYISRLLGNGHIDPDEVMQAYAEEVFQRQYYGMLTASAVWWDDLGRV